MLPELVFALNASESKSTNCVPYEVVFGRQALLPQDIIFDHGTFDENEQVSVGDYKDETTSVLQDVFDHVVKSLQINKKRMQEQYNKNLRFIDYTVGQKVWVKVKHYKTGENRKLAPRRDGPWTIVDKLPNGVNFRVENSRKQQKTVHHDRLSPFIAGSTPSEIGDNNIDNNTGLQKNIFLKVSKIF